MIYQTFETPRGSEFFGSVVGVFKVWFSTHPFVSYFPSSSWKSPEKRKLYLCWCLLQRGLEMQKVNLSTITSSCSGELDCSQLLKSTFSYVHFLTQLEILREPFLLLWHTGLAPWNEWAQFIHGPTTHDIGCSWVANLWFYDALTRKHRFSWKLEQVNKQVPSSVAQGKQRQQQQICR